MATGYWVSLGLAGPRAPARSLSGEVSEEVIPATRRTDFNHVKDRVVTLRKRSQLRLRFERSALRREAGTEREEHVDQVRLFTNWASCLCRLTKVRRNAQQLLLCVAYVELRQLTATKCPHGRITCESILNLTEPSGIGSVESGFR